MKKFYGWLGAAALLTLAACTKDIEGSKDLGADGDLYMTMTITQQLSTRTSTPHQGEEVGKDYENKISSGIVVIASENSSKNDYIVTAVGKIATESISATSPYKASFQTARKTLKDDLGEAPEKTYYLFVIANPTEQITTEYTGKVAEQKSVQSTFTLGQDVATYWTNDNFLMTNAEIAPVTIKASDLAEGQHTTQATALNLGTVKVQRAMSRFDIATGADYTKFEVNNAKAPTIKKVEITFEGVALGNMAKDANLFKTAGMNPNTYSKDGSAGWGYFVSETVDNYVFSPSQDNWLLPLFETPVSSGRLTGSQKNLSTLSFDKISTLAIPENADNDFTHPDKTPYGGAEEYYIWRYCMENTNYDKDNQYYGNSTSIVFHATMKMYGNEDSPLELSGPLYAFNNTIIGTLENLKSYVNNTDPQDGIYGAVKDAYNTALEADGGETVTDASLVANGFTVYRPDNSGVYHCYYIYRNRHNDNNNPGLMGPTEFATVRNNVYKLKVTKLLSLGKPGDPGDDPDPDDPGTPDESDEFWGEIKCEILPWEVRMNNIEF